MTAIHMDTPSFRTAAGAAQRRVPRSATESDRVPEARAAYEPRARRFSIDRLVEEAVIPWIEEGVNGIVRRHRLDAFGDDLRAECTLRVFSRLLQLIDDQRAVPDLRTWVLGSVRETCFEFVRHTWPERMSMAARVNLALAGDPRFATWHIAKEPVCGLREWASREDVVPLHAVPASGARHHNLARWLADIFVERAGPVFVNDLTAALLRAEAKVSNELAAGDERAPSLRADRDTLLAWWREIATLPVHQRVTLLFGFRDGAGEDLVSLLSSMDLVSLQEIEQAVGLSRDGFLRLWREAPASDEVLARFLGVGRASVAEFRASATTRLEWRMKRSVAPRVTHGSRHVRVARPRNRHAPPD